MTQITQMVTSVNICVILRQLWTRLAAVFRHNQPWHGWHASNATPILGDMRTASDDPESYAVISAAMEVHRCLGHGFLEPVYRDAMRRELSLGAVPFTAEVSFPIHYKGQELSVCYRTDLVCYSTVIVELKALRSLGGPEESQVLNYLKASGLTRALLLNFGAPRLEVRRYVSNNLSHSLG